MIEPHALSLGGILLIATLGLVLIVRDRLEGRESAETEGPSGQDQSMSDREQVTELLEENGGRMRQSDIVRSVDWSKAKVSRLLSELEDDGEVSKLRLGRENLVCLPGEEPHASRPPEQPGTD